LIVTWAVPVAVIKATRLKSAALYPPSLGLSWRSRLYTTSAGVTGWPSQNFTPGRRVNTIVVGDGFETVARPGSAEPSGAWRSSDSHINESAVYSGKAAS
jgi:hypothetical protein